MEEIAATERYGISADTGFAVEVSMLAFVAKGEIWVVQSYLVVLAQLLILLTTTYCQLIVDKKEKKRERGVESR